MSAAVAVSVITIFWVAVGLGGPFVVQGFFKSNPNKGIIQTMLVVTAVCCYTFWLCTYLSQYNPLTAPTLKKEVACFIRKEWDGIHDDTACLEE